MVRTIHEAESRKKAYSELTQNGFETYLPLRRELRQWSDRKKWVEAPVINSYIFVRVTKLEYRKVFEVRHIVGYVSYKGKAVPIPDKEIEVMKRAVENKLSFTVEMGTLKKGKTVTFTAGPLKGITGEITDIKGVKKIYLRVKHAGFTLVVNLEEGMLSE